MEISFKIAIAFLLARICRELSGIRKALEKNQKRRDNQ